VSATRSTATKESKENEAPVSIRLLFRASDIGSCLSAPSDRLVDIRTAVNGFVVSF
jgi:hypothetical protein